MEHTADEITSVVGREVYSTSGVYVGEVEDVRLDLDAERVTGLAVREINEDLFEDLVEDERGVLVPYRWVSAVGDVVLVSEAIDRIGPVDDEGGEAVA